MYLLIPAAGSGKRMGGDRNKLLMPLLGKPLIAWTLQAVRATEAIHWIGIIAQPQEWQDFRDVINSLALGRQVRLIEGGSTRQESVYRGLQALPAVAEQILIHDGARCLATPDLFNRCAQSVLTHPGLIAAVPVKDTIKVVSPGNHLVQSTPDRSKLWAAQTPQGFEVETLKKCHDEGIRKGWEVTDDAALFEHCKLPVHIVEGEETNLKVTTPIDLAIAEFILTKRMKGEGWSDQPTKRGEAFGQSLQP